MDKHIRFLKPRWDYALFFCNFLSLNMFSPYSKASRKEGIWLLSFVLLMFTPHSGPGTLFHCRSPLWASGLLQGTRSALLVPPRYPPQLLNSFYLPAPFGSSALVFLVLFSIHHNQHHSTVKDTVSFPSHNSCCSAVPQLPRWTPVFRRGVAPACPPGWPNHHLCGVPLSSP